RAVNLGKRTDLRSTRFVRLPIENATPRAALSRVAGTQAGADVLLEYCAKRRRWLATRAIHDCVWRRMQMNPHKHAQLNHPVHELIAAPWSPAGFADRRVSREDLCSLFEAARWAPSSSNEQPWSYIVATRSDSAEFAQLLSCLVEGNQVWARTAPVLAL